MSDEAVSILKNLANADRKRSSSADSSLLTQHIVEAIQAKKAKDILLIDMSEVSEIADYFVICTGESDLQIKAIVDGVDEDVRAAIGERPWRTEGYDARQWVLIDYVDVVVHVFDRERRSYYNLERLWADAPMEEISDDQ
ncbi:MAG: ribosome silencing factor [Rhodothermia bacterium]